MRTTEGFSVAISHRTADASVYEVLARWREQCLATDGSLFTPGQTIWTADNFQALRRIFTEQPDESSDSFLVKLQRQLKGAPDEIIQLFTEVLYMHLLIARDIGGAAKRDNLGAVQRLAGSPVEIPADLDAALDIGLMNTGVAYKTYRPHQLWLFIDFGLQFKQRERTKQTDLLEDPWAFKRFLESIPQEAAYTQFNGLLHMVHPKSFEDCVSREHKRLFREAFADLAPEDTEDIDQALLAIRRKLEQQAGGHVNLYSPEYRRQWDPNHRRPWDELARFALTVLDWPRFHEAERDYKLEFADELRPFLERVGDGGWADGLVRAIGRTKLANYRVLDTFKTWLREHPEDGEQAVRRLLAAGDVAERVDAFGEHVGDGAPTTGARLSLASAVLLALAPSEFPPYRSQAVDGYYRVLEQTTPSGVSDGQRYAAFLQLLDDVIDELAERNIVVQDRLDAQSMLWVLTQSSVDAEPLVLLDRDALQALQAWRGEIEDEVGTPDFPTEAQRRAARLEQLVHAFRETGGAPFLADDDQAARSRTLAVGALDELARTGDLATFAAAIRESDDALPHMRQGPHQTFLASIAKHAPDAHNAAQIISSAYRLDEDGEIPQDGLAVLAALTASVGSAGAPAADMAALAASAFWHMQNRTLPPLYRSAEKYVETLGWLDATEANGPERYESYRALFSTGPVDAMWAVEAARTVTAESWLPGLDPTLVDRCQENLSLLQVGQGDFEQSERNARTITGDLKLLGRSLTEDIGALLGQKAHVVTSNVSANAAGLHRADAFVAWRPPTSVSLPPNVRVWVAADGVAIGIHPGMRKDRLERASELAISNLPDDLVMIRSTWFSGDIRRLQPSPAEPTDMEFMVGRWLPGTEGLAREDLSEQIIAIASRLRPILGAWFTEFGGATLVSPDVEDDPLATTVERFLAERGYPLPKDRQWLEDRAAFARSLTHDALADFDLDAFRHMANSGKYGNAGPQAVLNTTLKQASADELVELANTIDHLLWGDGDVVDRIDDVLDPEKLKIKGLGESVVMKLLSIAHPERWLPVFPLEGPSGKQAFLDLLGLPAPTARTAGARHAEANDLLRERLEPFFPGDAHAMREFLYWWASREEATGEQADLDLVQEAADELHVSREFLDEIIDLLREKRQVVFYGPPGTGKTYLAKRLARALVKNDESRVRILQFHPSYAYEDFFEGYRPRIADDGDMVYELQKGPLAAMAEAAEAAPAAEHVMIVDEINRANLPKVFGELLFLLEYRDEPTYTQYRPNTPFTMPRKLYFIGTMNTADRSIALIDAALRRRFHFVPFFPHEGEIAGLLRRWLRDNDGPRWVADLVDMVNGELRDDLGGPHLQIGPSYFMVDGLSEARVERIWRYSVHPYIEEQLFGQPDRIAHYRFEQVMQRFRRAGGDLGETAEEGGDFDV